jgi:hypothetical protein
MIMAVEFPKTTCARLVLPRSMRCFSSSTITDMKLDETIQWCDIKDIIQFCGVDNSYWPIFGAKITTAEYFSAVDNFDP